MKKICFIASSGGHFEQIMMLNQLMGRHPSFIITEKTSYDLNIGDKKVYYLHQVNRKESLFIFKMIKNLYLSLRVFFKEKPELVISTGALSTIPMCLIIKLSGGKLIFIESFAKTNTPTLTGRLMYKIADRFYVQWESMLDVYPRAIYEGGIY